MDNSVSRAKICALVLLTATAVVAPYISVGYPHGDDLYDHVFRWFETARQWHEGVPYARWAGQTAYGYGSAALLFHPPLSRFLGGALVALLPSRMALGAFEWLGLVVGGFSFFYLCREFFDDRSSLAGAFAYIINPYNLAVLYMRSALAEFLAAVLFPLFILAVWRLGERGKRGVALLAFWIAVLWLTSPPAGVIANYLAALMVVALTLARRSKSLLGRFLVAEILGAGLAAIYLLPAWYQQRWISSDFFLEWKPLTFSSFLFAGEWYRSPFRSLGGWLDTGFLWQIFVGCLAWLYTRKFRCQRRDVSVTLAAVLVVSGLMCLPVSKVIWKHAPFVFSYVQWPGRWLFAVNLAVAFFIAAAVSQNQRRAWPGVAACAYSLLLILSCSAVRTHAQDWAELAAPFQSGARIQGASEWLPKGLKDLLEVTLRAAWSGSPRVAFLDRGEPPRSSSPSPATPPACDELAAISIQSWRTQSRVFTVESPKPARLRVRLLYFPGWHLLVNGAEVKNVEVDANGAVVVRVPSGHSQVQLVFKNTPDETWGMIISGVVAMLVAGLLLASADGQGRLSAAIGQL